MGCLRAAQEGGAHRVGHPRDAEEAIERGIKEYSIVERYRRRFREKSDGLAAMTTSFPGCSPSVQKARGIIGEGPGWFDRLESALKPGAVLPAAAAALAAATQGEDRERR